MDSAMDVAALKKRAELFGDGGRSTVDFGRRLGFGTDGYVWATHRNSAIKVLESGECYLRERDCYRRLFERMVDSIDGLAVPRLLDYDDELLIVEMEIVEPPYLLDFGKAYLDGIHPYSADQLRAYNRSLERHFREEDLPRVMRVCRTLRTYGIEYLDAKPKNIRLRSDAEEARLPDDDWEREVPEPPVDEDDR
jgi:hypothetical protein